MRNRIEAVILYVDVSKFTIITTMSGRSDVELLNKFYLTEDELDYSKMTEKEIIDYISNAIEKGKFINVVKAQNHKIYEYKNNGNYIYSKNITRVIFAYK